MLDNFQLTILHKIWPTRQYEKFIQVRHNSLILYTLPADNYSHKRSQFQSLTYTGKVTTGSGKRIRKAVDLLMQISKPILVVNPATKRMFYHTLSFITLTIPEQKNKPEASYGHKNLLAPWLLQMKRKHHLHTYIWKAEFQENGMLHYHITTPAVIHYQFIKDTWNNLLGQNHLLDEHFAKHNNQFPNSTDIHEVYKCKDIQHYLQKEISKTHQDKSTTGKIWDCSFNLKKSKHFSTPEPSNFNTDHLNHKVIILPQCTIVKISNPTAILPDKIKAQYKKHIQDIKDITRD